MKPQSPDTKWSYADVMKNDFFAPPWWRWERAFALATSPFRKSGRGTDDPMTLAAAEFIRSRACGSPREELARNHLPFGEAQAIFDDNGVTRWSVEAYTLAGMTTDAIADKLAIEPAVIRVYAEVMFDVRPRLGARDWICKHNYGIGAPGGLEPVDLGSLWRWVGYTAGVIALDAVRAVTTGIGTEKYPEALREAIERFVALQPFLSACTPLELLQLYLRVRALESGALASIDLVPALPTRGRTKPRRTKEGPILVDERDGVPLNSFTSVERNLSDARGETRGEASISGTWVNIDGKDGQQCRVSLGAGTIGQMHELLDVQELDGQERDEQELDEQKRREQQQQRLRVLELDDA